MSGNQNKHKEQIPTNNMYTGKFRKIFIALIFLLVAISLIGFNSCKKTKNCNIIVIVIDALRSDHLPFYGYKKNTAPFLSELSEKSIIFKNVFSTSSWTAPATASLFTSLYPFQHKVLMGLLALRQAKKINPKIEINKIPDKVTTIAEVLKRAGYKTYGISDNLNIGKMEGFEKGFDMFKTNNYEGGKKVNQTLKKWKTKITENGKYFLYIHYMDPHAPYHGRKPWYEEKDTYRENLISAYDSEINYTDECLKEVFELFKWDKNTLLIITSDHGEGLWDHGKMAHGNSLYREEIQVPLLIYLPSSRTKKEIRTNVSLIDILPTVRDYIGLKRSRKEEGISLKPLIENKTRKEKERYIFSYLWKKVKNKIEFRSTIYKNWQYIIKLPKKRELFNLQRDKMEKDNLFFNSKSEKLVNILEIKFNSFLSKCRKYEQEYYTYTLNKEKMEKLKSLGYVK